MTDYGPRKYGLGHVGWSETVKKDVSFERVSFKLQVKKKKAGFDSQGCGKGHLRWKE